MKKQKYYTKNENNKWEEVPEDIVNNIIKQYIERRYIGTLTLSSFIIGFLLGVIAS